MDHAGLEIAVDLYITSLFSHEMANGNPGAALESMGVKQSFLYIGYPLPRENDQNIPCQKKKQKKRENKFGI